MNLEPQGQDHTSERMSPRANQRVGFAWLSGNSARRNTYRRRTGGNMKNRRNAVIRAAFAGMLAAPLAFGPYAVSADELSDLRANQELLQQRLDQLAQAPVSPVGGLYPGGPPAPTAGTGIVGGS